MNTALGTTALLLMLAAAPAAFAQDSNTQGQSGSECPMDAAGQLIDQLPEKCRDQLDRWSAAQTGNNVDFQGEVAIGTVLPESVMIMEVPDYKHYGFAMVNGKRVLVEQKTRAIIKVY